LTKLFSFLIGGAATAAGVGGIYKTLNVSLIVGFPPPSPRRLQILTIQELLQGKRIDMSSIFRQVNVTFKKARKVQDKKGEQAELDL
jgi:hypothetical protein